MSGERKYGAKEGLADRLNDWIDRLSTDKALPWTGLGLIDDLRAAVDVLSPGSSAPDPRQQEMEYDL